MKIDFKNKTFWISLTSILVLMAQNLGELFGFEVQSEPVMNVVNTVCGTLVVLGILNNPTKTETSENTQNLQNDQNQSETNG